MSILSLYKKTSSIAVTRCGGGFGEIAGRNDVFSSLHPPIYIHYIKFLLLYFFDKTQKNRQIVNNLLKPAVVACFSG